MPLSAEQQRVYDEVVNGRSLFFTGAAGTGKSHLLRQIVAGLRRNRRQVYVTSSTGISACNVGGITLHRYVGAGLAKGTGAECIAQVKSRRQAATRWRKTDVLVVDEISMLPGEFFSKVDAIARAVRNAPSLPFGGLQLVLTGDFCQLPPVEKSSTYCFETDSWHEAIGEHTYLLTQPFRQKEGNAAFSSALERMRLGVVDDETVALLSTCTPGSARRSQADDDGIRPTKLYSLRREVSSYNEQELRKLPGPSFCFDSVDSGDIELLNRDCQAPQELQLRKGAQVILLQNLDVASGLANGSRGIVEEFSSNDSNLPVVRFRCGAVRTLEPCTWSIESPPGHVVASRRQIPLALAYAMTIHRSQGMSIDALEIDFQSVFETGQAYVALSRATNLDGLTIVNFDRRLIRSDPKVVAFYHALGRSHL